MIPSQTVQQVDCARVKNVAQLSHFTRLAQRQVQSRHQLLADLFLNQRHREA